SVRLNPGVLLFVFDLKPKAKPEVFTLKPIAEYGHRLVVDIYPAQAVDPLIALLEKSVADPVITPPTAKSPESASAVPEIQRATPTPENTRKSAPRTVKPDNQRLIIVALDAGHGGEDPGARGRGRAQDERVHIASASKIT